MKKVVVAILVLIAIAGIAFKARGLMKQRQKEIVEEPLPKKEQISVSLIKAKSGFMRDMREYLAIVQPTKDIKISTKMAGYIENIFVEESQQVKKGQLLATIDDSDINSNISLLQTNLIQQQNDLALAKQIYKRNQKLFAVGGLAKEQLDTSKVILEGKKSAIKATKQKIAQLQEQKTYLSIKAPFDGEIDKLLMHQGDLAVTGKPILSMSNGDKKLIFSFVPTKDNIQKSQEIYIDNQKIGQISKILTLAKQGLAQAEVKLAHKIDLPIGATINIDVLLRSKEGCIVPSNALLHKEDGVYVMVYRDNKFSPQKVESIMSEQNKEMIKPCPTDSMAIGSEVLLAKLPIYGEVEIRSDKN